MTTRRMASATGSGTTRRSSPRRSSPKETEAAVSPARWGGVALVIAAIMGAIFLAMVSPSDPGEPAQPALIAEAASPSPEPTTAEVPVPVAQPVITNPKDGKLTAEVEIAVSVDVPDDTTVPRKNLDLYVYTGGEAYTQERPKPGTTVTVEGVRLAPGENVLTAALGSPGGTGPSSEPVTIVVDENAPKLEIVSPAKKYETYEDGVTVEFTSEPGAAVRIVNKANGVNDERVVGAGGSDEKLVRLKYGKNRIEVTSKDEAGLERLDSIVVTRLDGRPTVKLKAPKSVSVGDTARVVVTVTDSKKQPMPDAEVHFSLAGTGRTAEEDVILTNAKGRAAWDVEIVGSSSPATSLELGATVISPSGDRKTRDREIPLD